jgi:citrate lyase subunit beta / citryl-CoA lyase
MTVRLRRSLLFVPGSTPERIAKAAATEADGIILDLEDAVAPGEKAQAREWVVAALRTVDFRGRERIVRVNALDGPHGGDDLAAVVPGAPDAVLAPKVGAPDEVARLDQALSRLEGAAGLEAGRIRVHLLIETVAGVLNAVEIARASSRTVALLFGAGDLIRETRGRLVPGRASELFALSQVLLAARAAGLAALDTPYFELENPAGLDVHTRFAADLGYDGKAVIHPKQIEVVNRHFTPSPETVADARRILEAYAEAAGQGSGALSLDGRFIDAVHVTMARQTLERARLAGVA